MNLQLVVFLFVYLLLLVLVRSLQRDLGRSRSDQDVAIATLSDRNVRILALDHSLKDWRDLADARAAELNEFQVKYDNLMAEKAEAFVRTNDDISKAQCRLQEAGERITALQAELKRKHRRSIVW